MLTKEGKKIRKSVNEWYKKQEKKIKEWTRNLEYPDSKIWRKRLKKIKSVVSRKWIVNSKIWYKRDDISFEYVPKGAFIKDQVYLTVLL